MKKVRFIINPKSGVADKASFGDMIKKNTDEKILDYEILFTNYPGHATLLAADAAKLNYDLVIVVGGDGSANEAGAGLKNTATTLGIIPTGSGNGMARHMKIPLDFGKAVRLFNNYNSVRIDTMTVNDRFAIGTFGLGFDGHIAHLFSRAGKRGYSTYVKLVLTEFYRYNPPRFSIVAAGKEIKQECFLLTFANSSQFGNNAVIAPFADVSDGRFDISIMKKFPLLAAPRLIYRMMNNTLHRSVYYEGFTADNAIIKNKGTMRGHIDGEPVDFEGDIHVKLIPSSLLMAVSLN